MSMAKAMRTELAQFIGSILLLIVTAVGLMPVHGVAEEGLLQGLVGWWAFEEGEGDVAFDQSENQNDAVMYGVTWVPGKIGKAVELAGPASYIEVRSSGQWLTSSFTIVLWFFPENFLVNKWTKVVQSGKPTATGFTINFWATNPDQAVKVECGVNNGNWHTISFLGPWPRGRWYFLALSYDSDSGLLRLCVDGAVREKTVAPGDLNIGTKRLLLGDSLEGLLDEVRVYGRTLTSEELAALFEEGG